MATITGFTAARMKEIEDASVVGGSIVGDNLILNRFDGTTIDAGIVRGSQGIQGVPGEVTTAALNAAIDGIQGVPLGGIIMHASSTVPTNFLKPEGQAISRATYSALFALIGTTYGGGDGTTTFNLPDLRNRFPVMIGTDIWSNTLNERGGSKDAVVAAHEHVFGHSHSGVTTNSDTHTHTANHNHTASSATAGAHGHIFAVRENMTAGGDLGEPMISNSTGTGDLRDTTTQPGHTHGITVNTNNFSTGSDAHAHTINAFSHTGSTSEVGVDPANTNLPPYITINFIIKVL